VREALLKLFNDLKEASAMAPQPKIALLRRDPIRALNRKLNHGQIFDARGTFAEVTFANMWRYQQTLVNRGTMRIDAQKHLPGGGANLHLQLNGEDRTASQGTTFANVTVDPRLRDFGRQNDHNIRRNIERTVRSAFLQSLETGYQYYVFLDS
jgi:hypothetical protein